MSDASDADDIESIKERKKAELREQRDGSGGHDEPIHVEDAAEFQDLIGGEDLVLVDFYADWCGPCKMLAPVVETIAAETTATVAKVDVDQHQNLAREYQVQGVPTVYLFADGESVERLVGMQDEGTLRDLIEQYA
jgi:thioredoxin 1